MSLYLYGVAARPGAGASWSGKSFSPGVGEPAAPVRVLAYRDLAALVSPVTAGTIGESGGVRSLRRDMAAHGQVLERATAATCVLPVRFGVMFPDEATLLEELLESQHDQLVDYLQRLDGTIEVKVSADYVEERILEDVIAQSGVARVRGASTYQQKIDAGRRIAQAIAARRNVDAQWLAQQLAPAALDLVTDHPASELAVLRASLLLKRGNLDSFDKLLSEIDRKVRPRMRLACVGPLPPYSFVRLHIRADRSEQGQADRTT